jgi:hypothetical protein
VLDLIHRPELAEATNGGREMANCEWCGRPGREVQLHVRSEDSSIEFGVPVLCDVCAGLVGFFPGPKSPRPNEPGFMEFMEQRAEETRSAARGELFRFLSENYVKKGKPARPWMVESKPGPKGSELG